MDEIEYLGATSTLLSYNLFTYCEGNPVNMTDVNGNWSLPNLAKIVIGVIATALAAAATVVSGGSAAPVVIGVAVSIVSGAISNATNQSINNFTSQSINNNYLEGVGEALIDGASDGLMWGGVSALVSVAISNAIRPNNDPIKQACKELDEKGIRPGQTEISRKKVLDIVDNFNTSKATSSVYSNGTTKYIVDGHHTTVASQILHKGTCANMGLPTSQLPSVTNVYWYKKWYEIGKKVIEIID